VEFSTQEYRCEVFVVNHHVSRISGDVNYSKAVFASMCWCYLLSFNILLGIAIALQIYVLHHS
jgi:hypothetical protein